MRVRKVLAKVCDKVFRPVVPKRLLMPFNYGLDRLRGVCEQELIYLNRVICTKSGIAVDVGANQGLYSYKLSKVFSSVYAEINRVCPKCCNMQHANRCLYFKGSDFFILRTSLSVQQPSQITGGVAP